MSGYLKSLFIIFMFLFICAYQSMAGLIVERERYEKGGGERVRGTIYIQENKIKFFDEEGQFFAIFDLNSGEMIQLTTYRGPTQQPRLRITFHITSNMLYRWKLQ